ncbi:MAG: hypothetical protein DBX55_02495 [Verrucomicrobia bacterium]|nr:MAG: hypothetical protein DBX55_02495 [Verrucomicrobiota bacterium]
MSVLPRGRTPDEVRARIAKERVFKNFCAPFARVRLSAHFFVFLRNFEGAPEFGRAWIFVECLRPFIFRFYVTRYRACCFRCRKSWERSAQGCALPAHWRNLRVLPRGRRPDEVRARIAKERVLKNFCAWRFAP